MHASTEQRNRERVHSLLRIATKDAANAVLRTSSRLQARWAPTALGVTDFGDEARPSAEYVLETRERLDTLKPDERKARDFAGQEPSPASAQAVTPAARARLPAPPRTPPPRQ